jgi:Leucine-rich repeat (LRR) protein
MHLDISKNKIQKLKLGSKSYLQQLQAQRNEIVDIDMPYVPLLTLCNLNGIYMQELTAENKLTELVLNDFPVLRQFESRSNEIATITKINAPKLLKLFLVRFSLN